MITDLGPKTICAIQYKYNIWVPYCLPCCIIRIQTAILRSWQCTYSYLLHEPWFAKVLIFYFHRQVLALHKLFLNVQMTQSMAARYNDGIFVLHTSTKYNGTIPTLLSSVNICRLFVKGFLNVITVHRH